MALEKSTMQLCSDSEFIGFLKEIVDSEMLEGAALGIAKMVIDGRAEELSDRQAYVFNKEILEPYGACLCERCGVTIPWCEMLEALDNGGYCSYCEHMMNKDD